MKALFKIFAGFLTDQAGNGSRKAVALYIFCYFFFVQIKAWIESAIKPDPYLMGVTAIVILFCLGAITAEWITKNWNPGEKTNTPQP